MNCDNCDKALDHLRMAEFTADALEHSYLAKVETCIDDEVLRERFTAGFYSLLRDLQEAVESLTEYLAE